MSAPEHPEELLQGSGGGDRPAGATDASSAFGAPGSREWRVNMDNRRKMAWRSFWLLATTAVALGTYGMTSDAAAGRIDKMWFFIASVHGFWTAIVLTYFGASSFLNYTSLRTGGKQ